MPSQPPKDPSRDGIVSIPFEFEFDPLKSEANRVKHGIDFIDAQRLWSDECRVEIPALSAVEARTQVIGQIDGVVWSAFVTPRGSRLRIISVRRARYGEKDFYIDGQGHLGE